MPEAPQGLPAAINAAVEALNKQTNEKQTTPITKKPGIQWLRSVKSAICNAINYLSKIIFGKTEQKEPKALSAHSSAPRDFEAGPTKTESVFKNFWNAKFGKPKLKPTPKMQPKESATTKELEGKAINVSEASFDENMDKGLPSNPLSCKELRNQLKTSGNVPDIQGEGGVKTLAEEEFERLDSYCEKGITHNFQMGLSPPYYNKNRYRNIMPNENTRVTLPDVTNEAGQKIEGYINGNHIVLDKTSQKYIATQGPLENTVADHYAAIITTNCPKSVMLTKFEEGGRIKCHNYFPTTQGETHGAGEYKVTCKSKEEILDCKDKEGKVNAFKYTLEITNQKGEKRNHEIFHFEGWPDHGEIEEVEPFLKFREAVNKTPTNGPLLVHCSAGVGRTGTFIAIDHLCSQLEKDKTGELQIDILKTVAKMRARRNNAMVQMPGQFTSIYKCVATRYEQLSPKQSDNPQQKKSGEPSVTGLNGSESSNDLQTQSPENTTTAQNNSKQLPRELVQLLDSRLTGTNGTIIDARKNEKGDYVLTIESLYEEYNKPSPRSEIIKSAAEIEPFLKLDKASAFKLAKTYYFTKNIPLVHKDVLPPKAGQSVLREGSDGLSFTLMIRYKKPVTVEGKTYSVARHKVEFDEESQQWKHGNIIFSSLDDIKNWQQALETKANSEA